MNKEKAIDKLKKLRELANRGVGGEAVNARRLFKLLLEKYGISENDLDFRSEERQQYNFEVNTLLQFLFAQVCGMVLNSYDGAQFTVDGVSVVCTLAQRLEILDLFEFYQKECLKKHQPVHKKYKAQLTALEKKRERILSNYGTKIYEATRAFVMANDIYPASAGSISPSEMSEKEWNEARRIASKASRMEKSIYHKQLPVNGSTA